MNGTRTETSTSFSARLRPRRPGLWLALLTVLAAWLRIAGVNKGLWWDEIYFLTISVRHPLAEILTTFPGDTQHPLYSVLARLSILAFGEHAWSLRLPAVVFGVATIPILYLLGVAVTTRAEAMLAAALLTVSYHHVWFSQDARGYSTLAFWALLSTLFLLRGIRTGRRSPYMAYALAASLGVFTHLTMMFLVASHLAICAAGAMSDWRKGLVSQKIRHTLLAFVMTGGLSLLFYLPVVMQVQKFFLKHPSAMRAVSTPRWALWETLRGLRFGLGTEGVLLGAALLVACGAWSYFRQDRVVFALFALPGVLTALGAILARGTMYPRFYFFLIGFAVLILVRGVVAIPQWIAAHWPRRLPNFGPRLAPALTAVLAIALLGAFALSLLRNYRYPKQDYEGAMQFVNAQKKEGESVVTAGASSYPYEKYYGTGWESIQTAERLQEICLHAPAVWMVYTMPRYLAAWSPPLAEMIRKEFTVIRVFPGTVGDGDVYIARFQPR